MPKLKGYFCRECGVEYEFLHHPADEPAKCPRCSSTDARVQLKVHVFRTIQATSLTSKQFKAGYVHRYVNRPAEKVAVSVPRAQGDK
jgi:putative FmdB family regulatory protein